MKRFAIGLLAAALVLTSCGGGTPKVGQTLPDWKKGELDIHFINTGRGECTYQILPDGTTFLTDASGSFWQPGPGPNNAPAPKPSADISAGKVIVDYINHFAPAVSEGHIDYFLLTHHHDDHVGGVIESLPMHESGLFRLSSFPEIGSSLVVDRIMDRDPDFTYPTPESQDEPIMNNYKAFLKWTQEVNGTVVERWKVGSHTQVVPLHNPDCGLTVQSYSGNGRFWTGGADEETFTLMPTTEEFEAGPKDAIPGENCYSCSYIMTYGDFDFFLGGDLQHDRRDKYAYMDAETPLINAVHRVEVMKANHHSTPNTHDPKLLAVLHPDVWLVGSRANCQPFPSTMDLVLAENPDCDIFTTNLDPYDIPVLGEERVAKLNAQGHIVVRVAKGGKSYMIYMLDDTDQEYRVKSIHGPYSCD